MNFEELGFKIVSDKQSYEATVSHLKDIEDRLIRIQKLQGGGGFGAKKSGGLATKGQIINDDLAKAQAKGQQDNYKLALKYARQYAQITDPVYKKIYDAGVKVKALKKQIETGNYLPEAEKNTTAQNENTNAVNENKSAIEKKVNAQKKEEKQTRRNTQSLSSYLSRLASVTVLARKIGHFISSAIKESSAYVENLNLFATAYGETYEDTLKWALDLADGFGLASNEVVKFAGTFRQLSTSLGLIGETADKVSQTVLKLGYDFSALFNTSVEQAMEKLQSGIFSGNVRPLRAFGIDISQNQIDALFEANQALAQMGVNARNLSQSDKVLARLIITMQSGSNAFGTMNREINNLQSQFRIFQGSMANFKLAVGDLVEEPLREVMVLINAFIIALTNIIRSFVGIKTEDKNTVFGNLGEEADAASEAIDNLNGKLATFDKFNVLGGSSSGGGLGNQAVTEQLTKMLEVEMEKYENAMVDLENEAKELAKAIEPIAGLLGAILAVWSVSKISAMIKSIKGLTASLFGLNGGLKLTNTLIIGSLIYAIVKMVQAFKEGDWVTGVLAATIGVSLLGAIIALNKKGLLVLWQNIGKKLIPVIISAIASFGGLKAMLLSVASAAVTGGLAFIGAFAILKLFSGESQRLVGGIMAIAGAFIALTTAILAYKGALTWGTALPILTASIGAAIAGGMAWKGQIESIAGFADGGYTNANLIMTHENGKREWVGKAAGSSAIVNDTQMSDIMEVAVAKGVYNALSARSAMGGNTPTNETIVVKIGEEAVFNAVRKTAKRQGRDFARV